MKIKEIDALRGLLAWWVVTDHLLGISGYSTGQLTGTAKFLREGWLAVDVFIIISGFVIALSLSQKKDTSYRSYILRRFFRIFPIFVITVFIAILLTPNAIEINTKLLPVTNISPFIDILIHDLNNLKWNVFSKITMLYGMIPNEVLYNATSSFLAPSWSVSLEWQFYIVAPLIIGGLDKVFQLNFRGNVTHIVVSILFICLMFYTYYNIKLTYNHPAFLPLKFHYFMVGILTWKVLDKILKNNAIKKSHLIVPLILSLISLYLLNTPLTIWFFTIFLILFNRLFNSFNFKIICWLGEISYSTYLSHFIVIYITQNILLNFGLVNPINTTKFEFFVYLSGLTIPLTILSSYLGYKYVESPFNKIGLKLSRKILR